MVAVWAGAGWHAILYLAYLQSIPVEYNEVAKIDGASPVRQFFHITLPLLTPAIVVSQFLLMTDGLKVYDLPFTLTGGGPGFATRTITQSIITSGVAQGRYGLASALAVMFTIAVGVFALDPDPGLPDRGTEDPVTSNRKLRYVVLSVVMIAIAVPHRSAAVLHRRQHAEDAGPRWSPHRSACPRQLYLRQLPARSSPTSPWPEPSSTRCTSPSLGVVFQLRRRAPWPRTGWSCGTPGSTASSAPSCCSSFVVPGQATLVPLYLMLVDANQVDTLTGLVIMYLAGAVFCFFLIQGYMTLAAVRDHRGGQDRRRRGGPDLLADRAAADPPDPGHGRGVPDHVGVERLHHPQRVHLLPGEADHRAAGVQRGRRVHRPTGPPS